MLNFTLESKDFHAFLGYWTRRVSRSRGRRYNLVCLVLLAGLAILIFYNLEILLAIDRKQLILYSVSLVMLMLVASAYRNWRQVKGWQKTLSGMQTVNVDEVGLCHGNSDTQMITRWEAIDDVTQTREHIFLVYGRINPLIIPKRAFSGEGALAAFLTSLRRYRPELEVETPENVKKRGFRRRRRIIVACAVILLLAFMVVWKPWRSSIVIAETGERVSYLVTVSGDAGGNAALPLVLDLHPLGGSPELGLFLHRVSDDLQARVVLPAGEDWYAVGYSWFDFDGSHDAFVSDVREAAARMAAFTEEMLRRYPTVGKPIVTGFSQGGSMSYALAILYPELFAAAVPVSGAYGDRLPSGAPPKIKIRAFHGAEDAIIPEAWAAETIGAMRGKGWNVEYTTYPDRGHAIGSEAKAAWEATLRDLIAEQARR